MPHHVRRRAQQKHGQDGGRKIARSIPRHKSVTIGLKGYVTRVLMHQGMPQRGVCVPGGTWPDPIKPKPKKFLLITCNTDKNAKACRLIRLRMHGTPLLGRGRPAVYDGAKCVLSWGTCRSSVRGGLF